jgi:hypothetical protein
MENIVKIKLRNLSQVKFSAEDVLSEDTQRKLRYFYLRRAVTLGNLYKNKVKIHFKTLGGQVNRVDATIWSVGDQFVSLSAGNHIPIKSIESIEF